MIYDLSKDNDKNRAKERFTFALNKGVKLELKQVSNSRSSLQNRALHKFFVLICEQLNEIGQEFTYTGLKGLELSTRYTPEIVKNFFWRPIQISLFDIESTRKINTQQLNEIADVIIKFFGDKGILIDFPRRELNN